MLKMFSYISVPLSGDLNKSTVEKICVCMKISSFSREREGEADEAFKYI